mgnify:FL=1
MKLFLKGAWNYFKSQWVQKKKNYPMEVIRYAVT